MVKTASADGRIAWAAVMLVAAAVVFGGASRENPVRLALVELAALPLGMLALRQWIRSGVSGQLRFPVAMLGIMAAIPVLQLVPLPPDIWTALPGQGPRVEALRLAGLPPGWRGLTFAPSESRNAVLALMPPIAMFLGASLLDLGARKRIVVVWIGLTGIGLGLGMAQLASPGGGIAYPYATTNLGSLVGWFANRNHEAGCLLAALPFAAALMGMERSEAPIWRRWALGGSCVILIVALAVVRSRAGVVLGAPVLAASLALAWAEYRKSARGRNTAMIGLATATAAALAVPAALSPVLDRFTRPAAIEFRFEAWPVVVKAAEEHLPFGAGVGAFDRVFRAVEPLKLVAAHYFNHAHNDYLETWLETGWMGAALILAFAGWSAAAVFKAWKGHDALTRAAAIAVPALLAQSFVDYPLRTESLAVWFAFCCGLLAKRGEPTDLTLPVA